MLFINLQNVEDLILIDPKARSMLSGLTHIIDQWLLSQRIPALRSLSKQSKIDLLNNISSEHLENLEEYFGDSISLDKIDYHLIKEFDIPLENIGVLNLDKTFTAAEGFSNFAVTRNAGRLYVSFWR